MHLRSTARSATLVAIVAIISFAGSGFAPASAAPAKKTGHDAGAFGTSIQIGSVISSGPTAVASLGCTNKAGVSYTNSAASGGLLAAGTVGAITDEVSTTKTTTLAKSTVHNLGLFSNLITATAVAIDATASVTGTTFGTNGNMIAGSLVINGSPITAPAPNTVIPLPGVGNVTVNEQISSIKSDSASLTVNALHIDVLVTNVFNFPVGTDILVGHAKAALDQREKKLVDGHAYGSQIIGTAAVAGKTTVVNLPCQGTNGNIRTNSTLSSDVPNVLSTGLQKSTGTATADKFSANVVTTSALTNVSLLGIVSVDSVKAQANAQAFDTDFTFSDEGSTFGNLSVLGIPTIPEQVPPNSVYDLPGVGTLYLHRIIQTGRRIEVRMIEIVLAVPVGPLAVGTDIRIGVAEASLH